MCQACDADFSALCQRLAVVRQTVAEGLAEEIHLGTLLDAVLDGELHGS